MDRSALFFAPIFVAAALVALLLACSVVRTAFGESERVQHAMTSVVPVLVGGLYLCATVFVGVIVASLFH